MLPKIIHYCWFGGKPLSKLSIKCIESWKKFLPDYEIKEWNEDNFNVNIIPYTQEAYKAKRWAFVSDYARFWILYNYGGIYFDTDVELIRPIDDIINLGGFMGCETIAHKNIPFFINPGLGIGCEAGNPTYKGLLELYSKTCFFMENGEQNLKSIVYYTSEYLETLGLVKKDTIQCINCIYIYPKDYFNPYDADSGKVIITENTRTIHHFAGSWFTPKERIMKFIEKKMGGRIATIVHRCYQIYKYVFKKATNKNI